MAFLFLAEVFAHNLPGADPSGKMPPITFPFTLKNSLFPFLHEDDGVSGDFPSFLHHTVEATSSLLTVFSRDD